MRRPSRALPADLADCPWPDVASNDPSGEVARRFVVNLRTAIGDRSIRSVAAAAGISHGTLNTVLAGRTWPDLLTVARLEQELRVTLWPQRQWD